MATATVLVAHHHRRHSRVSVDKGAERAASNAMHFPSAAELARSRARSQSLIDTFRTWTRQSGLHADAPPLTVSTHTAFGQLYPRVRIPRARAIASCLCRSVQTALFPPAAVTWALAQWGKPLISTMKSESSVLNRAKHLMLLSR
jgi:hypothetical protein